MNFTATRARRSHPETSRQAAKTAASNQSAMNRHSITQTVRLYTVPYAVGWTAKEIAEYNDMDLATVYRRLPECAGIKPHDSHSKEWLPGLGEGRHGEVNGRP